jgi:hypothetical protein
MDTVSRASKRISAVAALAMAGLALGALSGCERAEPEPRVLQLVKLDAAGQAMDPRLASDPHHCVLDHATGLVWSVEQAAPGLMHYGHTYSWFSSNPLRHMTEPGQQGGGECSLERCDTESLVEAVNAAALCGRQDWRLPTREEALALRDPSRIGRGATLDPVYFPAAVPEEYWTATTFSMYPQGAWVFDARHGHDRVDWKSTPKHVRLVAGAPRH